MHNRYPVLHRNTVYLSIVLSSQKEAPQTKGQTGRAANTLGYQRSRALSFKGNTNTRNVCLCCQQDGSWYSGYKKTDVRSQTLGYETPHTPSSYANSSRGACMCPTRQQLEPCARQLCSRLPYNTLNPTNGDQNPTI